MKCPIHNQEMLIRNGGGDDFHTNIEFECPHPECHHWYVVVNQRSLVEGWRKRPDPAKADNERPYPGPKREIVPPEGYKMTPERRKSYLNAPRRMVYLSHYVKTDQGELFKDEINETEQ